MSEVVLCHAPHRPPLGTLTAAAEPTWPAPAGGTPARSRRPLALCIWAGLIWEVVRAHSWHMGVYLLWLVVAYMRPSEPLLLTKRDLLQPKRLCFKVY